MAAGFIACLLRNCPKFFLPHSETGDDGLDTRYDTQIHHAGIEGDQLPT